jgi:hypothetical protein
VTPEFAVKHGQRLTLTAGEATWAVLLALSAESLQSSDGIGHFELAAALITLGERAERAWLEMVEQDESAQWNYDQYTAVDALIEALEKEGNGWLSDRAVAAAVRRGIGE